MIASRPLENPHRTAMATAKKKSPAAAKAPKAPSERQAPVNPPSVPSKELQVFKNPAPQRDYLLQFQVPEFTCHCPLTKQPDFAHFVIEMVADEWCVELKSLKMYMWSYRDEGAFHEAVTNQILDDIVKATNPRFCRVKARWYVRGGIYTNVVVEHRKKGWKPQAPVEFGGAEFPRETGMLG